MSVKEKNLELNALVAYYLERSGYSMRDLATKLGMCLSSLYNKLNEPNRFTFGEIRMLIQIMNLDANKILEVV